MKRILTVLCVLAVVLTCGLIPFSANAEIVATPPTVDVSGFVGADDIADTYGVWAYDSTHKALNIYKNVTLTGTNPSMVTVIDPAVTEITIKNLNIGNLDAECYCDGGGYKEVFCGAYDDTAIDITFNIEGENSVTLNYVGDENYLFYFDCTVTLGGSGKLTVDDVTDYNTVFFTNRKTVLDGPVIDCGINEIITDAIDVKSGELTGGALQPNGDLNMSGGKIIASGILVNSSDITVSGGLLDAKDGLIDAGNLTVSGGKVTTEGLYIWEKLTVSGGCIKSGLCDGGISLPGKEPFDISAEIGSLYEGPLEEMYQVTEPAKILSGSFIENTAESKMYFKDEMHICAPYAISPISDNGALTVAESAFHGEKVEFSAAANEGYEIESVTLNGTVIEGSSFTMPEENVELVVNYKKTATQPTPPVVPPTSDGTVNFIPFAVLSLAGLTLAAVLKKKKA